jgi:uncharacterized protein
MRVRENGLRLAALTRANPEIVELFAFLHDSKRHDDGRDMEHGPRAAEFIRSLRGSLVTLDGEDFDLLVYACEQHTYGLVEAHVTVQTCWDADRLDIPRADIVIDPKYLCTEAAKDPEVIAWATARSFKVPDGVPPAKDGG